MFETLKLLGISVLVAFGLTGYILLLNFLIETPKYLAQIAKSLKALDERMSSDGSRR